MGHGHHHDHGAAGHAHGPPRGPDAVRPLSIALALTAGFLVAEVVGGVLSDSLALLADAGHMLSDVASLALAAWAAWLARRPSTPRFSYGLRRAEILAALVNAVTLVAVAIWVFVEAAQRLADPPEVRGGIVLVVGALGLLVNLASALVLARAGGGLNVRAALGHVLADAAGSVGVLVSAVIVLTTGWEYADPLVSILIGVLILWGARGILAEAVAVLLEAAPAGMDVDEVGHAMASVPGVAEVHDLHVWTIGSGFPALSAHVLVRAGADEHEVRAAVAGLLAERFAVEHCTLQTGPAPGVVLIRPAEGP